MATSDAAQAMEQVLTIAGRADTASQSVLTAAEEVGRIAETLHVEVNDFLSAVSGDDASERRNHERVSGGDATASLRIRGAPRCGRWRRISRVAASRCDATVRCRPGRGGGRLARRRRCVGQDRGIRESLDFPGVPPGRHDAWTGGYGTARVQAASAPHRGVTCSDGRMARRYVVCCPRIGRAVRLILTLKHRRHLEPRRIPRLP
jgi:hypothetical protein